MRLYQDYLLCREGQSHDCYGKGDIMFSIAQKRKIAEQVQQILRETNHPELPEGEIDFMLTVDGAEGWSRAQIRNNGAVLNPSINPFNEAQDKTL